jgi:hypothetical protein
MPAVIEDLLKVFNPKTQIGGYFVRPTYHVTVLFIG